jgi:polysaccharide pyruvyl transferase WcaK-like protein
LKGNPVRVAVIGNYSGRNAGDAAILGGLLRDITETYPERDFAFEVPTINPGFIRRAYPEYPVRPVGLLPWHLSVKILGLPIVRCVLRADLVLVTDAILFDHKLYNPLFNYLHTLSWVLPMAARRGVPIVLYNVSLGPVYTEAGRDWLIRVLE